MMAVFSEESLRQRPSRGLGRGTGFTGVFRTPSSITISRGVWGASVPEAVLKLEEGIRFSRRLLFFPKQGGIFSDEGIFWRTVFS